MLEIIVFFIFIFIFKYRSWVVFTYTFLSTTFQTFLIWQSVRVEVELNIRIRLDPFLDQNKIWILNCGSLDRFTADGSVSDSVPDPVVHENATPNPGFAVTLEVKS